MKFLARVILTALLVSLIALSLANLLQPTGTLSDVLETIFLSGAAVAVLVGIVGLWSHDFDSNLNS